MPFPDALALLCQVGLLPYYSYSFCGTESIYRYNKMVLADLDDDELLSSDNPIDFVLYAGKQAALSRTELQKYHYLRVVTGLLAERGWSMEEKRDLLLFIERILYLEDKSLSAQYKGYLQELSEEGKIVYIPFYERDEGLR
jgi:hypothetical protein